MNENNNMNGTEKQSTSLNLKNWQIALIVIGSVVSVCVLFFGAMIYSIEQDEKNAIANGTAKVYTPAGAPIVQYINNLELYEHDYGNYTKEDMYSFVSDIMYDESGLYYCKDLTRNGEVILNDMMRENEYNAGCKIKLEGEVTFFLDEYNIRVHDFCSAQEIMNGIYDESFYYVDISLLDTEIYEGDKITLEAVYCGKIATNDGTYLPSIVATNVYFN